MGEGKQMGVVIKLWHGADLCVVGTVLYVECGSGYVNSHM